MDKENKTKEVNTNGVILLIGLLLLSYLISSSLVNQFEGPTIVFCPQGIEHSKEGITFIEMSCEDGIDNPKETGNRTIMRFIDNGDGTYNLTQERITDGVRT